jgi:hypothetical protein
MCYYTRFSNRKNKNNGKTAQKKNGNESKPETRKILRQSTYAVLSNSLLIKRRILVMMRLPLLVK